MDAKQQLVKSWLNKARRDLLSAKRLAGGKEPYFDTAIYHCQQSTEKAIKGWLVYHDLTFEKTHDLRLLVTLAVEIEPKFEIWFDAAEQINPSRNPEDRPSYQVTATVKGYRPELSSKIHLLKLNETLAGQVFIHIIGIPDMSQTTFSVNLQDAVWDNLEWFQLI